MTDTFLGLSRDRVRALLTTAVRAPSVHNTQPWRFAAHADRLELSADPDRRLRYADPLDKGLRLSCGAVLMNLRLLLQDNGIRPIVSLLPADDEQDLMAVVRPGGVVTPSDETRRLVAAIPRRVTNRAPFLDAQVPVESRVALERAVQSEGAWAHVVDDPAERAAVRKLIATAHREQLAVAGYRDEWTAWTSGRPEHEGVPARSAGPLPAPQDEWVHRDFSDGRGRTRVPGKDFEPDPLIIVLCSFFQGRLAELVAGQALQSLLLTATDLGLSASLLSQPLEVEHTRAELGRIVGPALHPQTILRIGFGSPVPPTPRRAVEDVFIDMSPDGGTLVLGPPATTGHTEH